MKSTIFGLVCGIALVAGPVSAGAAPMQSAAVKTSDRTLSDQIETRVHQDAALKKHAVKISVDAGVATLTGIVSSTTEKTRAGQLARVKGITRVDNQLIVDRSAADAVAQGTKGTLEETKAAAKDAGESTKELAKDAGQSTKELAKDAGEKTKEVAKEVGEKTKDGAVKVGEKTKEGVNKVGSEISDALILASVKSKFVGEEALKGSDINVDCDQHIIRLRGTVTSAAGRARAMDIASRTEGVKHVIDELTIGPKN